MAAASGGVYVVDVADPRQPVLLSGGNTERAFDVLPVGDRLLVASQQELTELAVPFLLPIASTPEREALVPPVPGPLEVRFNRPLAPTSVNASSVKLTGPSGPVPLGLSVVSLPATLTYALRATLPAEGLEPGATYELRVEATVADQKGGGMIRPWRTTFHTGAAGSLQPRIDTVQPSAVSMTGGQQVVLRGSGLGHVAKVRLGTTEAVFSTVGDGELRLTVPASVRPGPVDVRVEDAGGPWASLPHGLLYLSSFAGAHASLHPDHGSPEGGTEVTVDFGTASPVAPGTRVLVGDSPGVDVDVVSLSSVHFTTPRPVGAGLVPVKLVRPGEAPETVGFFSYDLPTGTTMDLPGFPPREPSEVVLSGDILLVGVPTPHYEGLELFNVRTPEHPLRLGGLRTDGPVRGVDARGALALLATDVFGLVAANVEDPAHPFSVSRASTAGLATGVRLEGSLAHVSVTQMDGGAGYVQTFDVSQPSLPLVSTTPLTEDALALEPTPGRFYTLTSNVRTGQKDGLRLTVYTRQGVRVGGVVVDATPRTYEEWVRSRLTVRGGRAYVTVGSRLYVFDVSHEATPVVLQSTELGAPALGLTWSGGSLLVSTSGASTLVTVPPTDLLVVGTSPVDGALASPFTPIRVDMSLPVQPDSLTAGTFAVNQVGPGGTRPVEGTREVVFATRGSSLVFTPAAPLVAGSRLEVTVDGVRGFDTRPLAQPLFFAFTVAGDSSLQPVLERLEPASGLVGEFTATTVKGSGFRAGVTVKIAGQAATVLSVQPDHLDIVVPPSLTVSGPAAVQVIDPSGLSALRLGGFLYREPLRLALLSPDRSPQQGGVAVELRGTGFMPGLGVRFGGTSSFQVDVTSMERAVAVAPPHAQGLVDVEALLGARSVVKTRSFLYGTGAVSRLPTPPVRDVRVEGSVAYVALGGESDIVGLDAEGHLVTYEQGRKTTTGGLMVADIGEPTVAREVKRLTLSVAGGVRRMAKAGNTLYLAAGAQGVVAVDVTQPANAAVVLTLPVQGEAVDVVAADSLLFVADGGGVRVFRTGETEQPMLVAQRALPGGASALALYGELLLVSNASTTDARLYVLDARRGDLAPLAAEAWLPLSAPAKHIVVEGTRAFVSLGRAGQVALVELTVPTAPAPAGTLVLKDELQQGWVSAEQALVAGDVVWVASGGGKVQRFVAPVGQTPRWLETASVLGDAKALARAGRYLLTGTLLLDVEGRPAELPLAAEQDKAGVLAGGLVSVALDHLELRGTQPVAGAVVPVGVVPQVLLSALPDPATASAVRLEGSDGAEVRVARQTHSDVEGGLIALVPQAPLAVGSDYVLRVGATLADLGGRELGTSVDVRFRTGPIAAPEQPVLQAMAPTTGLEAGGDTAVLSGEGFLPGCQVWVGDALASGVMVSPDGTHVTLQVPPGPAGAAAVRVRNPNGLEALRLGLYRYLVLPELTQVVPAQAPFNSRQRILLTGKGFAATTQVTLGGRPALHPVLDSQGRLSVEVPDEVTGVVEVAVATPIPSGVRTASLPEGFTYTLRPLGTAGGAEALAVAGRVLLVAREGRLVALDLTRPGDLPEVANVEGVTSAGGLAVVGEEAWLSGQGQVAHYALADCGASLPVSCPLQLIERIALVGSGSGSVAAGSGTAYVTVAGGSEVVLLGRVDGLTRVVAQVDVGPGVVRGVAMAGPVLAVLVEGSSSGRLELRDVADGSLALVGQASGLPRPLRWLAAEGTRVAVASDAGTRIYETVEPALPFLVGTWETSGRSFSVALSGPWALASGDHGLAWLDTTQGIKRRTRSDTLGYAPLLAVGAGVAVAASIGELRTFELPYPTLSGQQPLPGRTLPFGGAVSVTLAERLPPAVAQGTGLALVGSAGSIAGTRSVQGSAVLFQPSAPLMPGVPVQARVTFAATPYVGGTVNAPWSWSVLPAAEASPIRVDSVLPGYGSVVGGFPAVLRGAGFDEQTLVRFGSQVVTVVPPVAANQLQVVVPASPLPGPVRVRVSQGPLGTAVDVPGGFTYVAPLSLIRVTPARVDLAGGGVLVEGTGFNRGLTVRLGGVTLPVSDFTPTSFRLQVPPGEDGWLDLEVTQAGTAPVVLAHAVLRRDSVPPVVTSWEPLDTTGSTQVPLGSAFTLRFNEPIEPATASSVRLVRKAGTVPEPGTTTVSADARGVTFTPASPLPSTTAFVLSAVGVEDRFGNAIVASDKSQREFTSRDVVAPSVYLRLENSTQPLAPGALLAAEVDWPLRVVATDDSNVIGSLTLWVDGVPVSVAADGRATYRWPASMRTQSSTLRVRAVDGAGNAAESQVTVQVVEDMPPTVSLTQPPAGTQVEQGAALTVALSASDNHALSAVEVRLDGAVVRRASGLTSASTTLTHVLRMSVPGTHQLSALAIDDRGQISTSESVPVVVTVDTTPPQLAWTLPGVDSKLVGGARYPLQVAASDSNGVSSVTFSVDGAVLATRTSGPWSVDWTPPDVSAPVARVLEARAKDARGNESTVSLPVTVVPPSVSRPSIVFLNRGPSFREGALATLQVQVRSEATVAQVRLSLGAAEVTLTQPPWQYTFRAPQLELAPGTVLARASALDVLGRESLTDVMAVTITDDGLVTGGPEPLLQPRGPVWLGGSALSAQKADGSPVTGIAVRVGSTRLAPDATGGYSLPLAPDGAPMSVSAALESPDDGWLLPEKTGALTTFAQGAVRRLAATDEPVVGVAARGGWMLVLRETGGGRGRVELLDAVTQEKRAERSLEGFARAVSFLGGRAVVALRTGAQGRLEVLELPTLQPVVAWTVSRPPKALEPVGSGLVVGTDEGLELRNEAGQVAARLGLGEIQALASEGERLAVLAGGSLHEVDVQLPQAPVVRASVTGLSGSAVAALAGGRRCVVGDTARCFQATDTGLSLLGETRLPGVASSAEAMGPWLLVGTSQGLSVVDTRTVPSTAGHYRAVKGLVRATGGRILAAARGEVFRLELQRSAGPLGVQLALPASAAPGARVALGASVEGLTDSRDGYEVELRVNGTLVQGEHGRLPVFVDLPRSGTQALVGLRLIDLAGHAASAEGTVSLVDDGAGPALLAVRTRSEVPSGALWTVAAVAADPARVVDVEYAVEGTVVGVAHAPALAWEMHAPAVSVDTSVTVSAVALDALGRRGPAVTSTVLVRPNVSPPPGLSLARVGTGPLLEGSWVRVRATLAPQPASAEVRFRLEGVELERASLPPYEALLRMPVGTGSRVVQVEAVAVDGDGRESALAQLSLTVVDDLTPPVLSLSVDPSGTLVAAGSEVRAGVTVTDTGELESWSLRATVAGVEVASGGSQLSFTLPVGTAPGTQVEVVATARDLAGNAATARAQRTVVVPTLPGVGSVAGGAFAGALRLSRVGSTVYAMTPAGLAIGRVPEGASAQIEPLGFLPTDGLPTALAVRGGLAVLGLSGDRLWVVDVSDPAHPRTVGSLGSVPVLQATVGDEFYVQANGTLYWMDLETPSLPGLRNFTSGLTLLRGPQNGMVGAYSDHSTWMLSPRSDGNQETLYGPVITGVPRMAQWHDGRMWLGTDRSLAALSRNDPSSASLSVGAELPLPAGVRAMAISGGRAWVACEDDRLRVVDVRDPSAPQVIASEALVATGVEVFGDLLILSTPDGLVTRRLPVVGASGPALAVQVGSVPLDDAAKGLTAFRRGVLVAAGLTGAQVVSLDDPTRPVRTRQLVAGLALRQVEHLGQDVFTLDGQSLAVGLERTDGHVDRDTTRTSRLAALGNTERFAVSSRRVWTVSGGKVSTVALPGADAAASLLLGSATVDVAGDESHAVVALGAAGAAVVGVDAAGTLWRASLVADTPADAVALDGTLAVLGGSSGLALVDVSDLGAPVRRASVPTAGPVRRVRLSGGLALVSEGLAGVELWDVSVPAAPVRLATLAAPRAEDAIVAAGQVVVADGTGGVKTFPLPAAALRPSVRLMPGVEEMEPGVGVDLVAETSGVGLDGAELLVDGQVWGSLDDASPRMRVRILVQTSLGHELSLQVRARSATGAQVLSAPRRVRIVRSSALPAAPTLTLNSPSASGVTTASSGGQLYVWISRSGGLDPVSLRARWAGRELGPLVLGTYSDGYVLMPVVTADTTAAFEVILTDAAGRSQTRSAQVKVRAPGPAPSAPTDLPTVLYAAPYSNGMQVRALNMSGDVLSLRLEVDGIQVGREEVTNGSSTVYLPVNLVLPASSPPGSQVTLVAVAEDLLGRQARTQRVYTVQSDDFVPTVSLGGLSGTAIERTTANISVYPAAPPGHLLRSARLLANGVEIASSTGASIYKPYTFPNVADVAQVLFEAVVKDHLGREGRSSLKVNLQPDMPPQVDATVEGGDPLLTTGSYSVCGTALDDVRVVSARLRFGDEVLWQCSSGYCSISRVCYTRTVPLTATQVQVTMEATDSSGQTVSRQRTYPVVQDQPPLIHVWASREPLVRGAPFEACVSANDDVTLASLKLKLGETILWQCSGAACSNVATRCVEATAPEADSLLLSAAATDSSARPALTSREYALQVDQPPQVEPWVERKPLVPGASYEVCAKALDDVRVATLRLRVGAELAWECTGSCATWRKCVTRTVPSAAHLDVSVEATDSRGQSVLQAKSYAIEPPAPPAASPGRASPVWEPRP